ncbi:MAG: hypothetical protein HUU20_11740 [Pirellulales bacterium]|nr:hypothetical protein [Pirellulales bacterium]
MAQVRCEVFEGLRRSESVAKVVNWRGRNHFIRVEHDFLSDEPGGTFLPVGIVHVDPKTKAVLVELPHEAETGANRLWVRQDQPDEPIEAYT